MGLGSGNIGFQAMRGLPKREYEDLYKTWWLDPPIQLFRIPPYLIRPKNIPKARNNYNVAKGGLVFEKIFK